MTISSNLAQGLKNISKKLFTDATLKKGLNNEKLFDRFIQARKTGGTLSKEDQNEIAEVLKEWALEHGCYSYVHWFSPMRDGMGEKHESFIDLDYKTGDMKIAFSGVRLFSGETDGSSFPNGGMRTTHTAGAYTAWDTSSPPFVRGDSLYIPTSLATYNGEALDYKTPLLRAEYALSQQGSRVLKCLGEEPQLIKSCNGWEQEFFVVGKEAYEKRPDLKECGRTLVGNLPPRGQQTSVDYFGLVPGKVKAFLRDVQSELWSCGVSISTLHNEVAPGQHEFAPIFTTSTVSADTNSLAMEVLNQVSARHGLHVILSEKPFKGMNGSGKHNNWGLNKESGENLLTPGKTKDEQRRFITFVAAILRAVDVHGDLLRIGIASAHNDWRLGAHEAPPSIISLYLGEQLTSHMENVANGGDLHGYVGGAEVLNFGAPSVLLVTNKGVEDRNRTSPFPFCGNRFEFRAVGGGANINRPLAYLNTAVADSLCYLADQVESGKAVDEVVRDLIKNHGKAIFNGNGYSAEWVEEAKRRKLFNLPSTIEALAELTSPKNLQVFQKHKVFRENEIYANQEIFYEQYNNQVKIEAHTLTRMVNIQVVPAVYKDLKLAKEAGVSPNLVKETNSLKEQELSALVKEQEKLNQLVDKIPEDDSKKEAYYLRNTIIPQMGVVRKHVDALELLVSKENWPFPSYEELLRAHH